MSVQLVHASVSMSQQQWNRVNSTYRSGGGHTGEEGPV